MGQLLVVLLIVGVGIWLMRRGGCCGMGKRDEKESPQEHTKSCH